MTQISRAVGGARQAAMSGLTDAELLTSFLDGRDEAAFAALVQRHASMVWGVCRRLLSQPDAEDAFQAVFVVLFRRAGALRPRTMVANWSYGVAQQTALHARRTNARRTKRERQVRAMPEPVAKETGAQRELRWVLDAELGRLPDRYRAVIVLCDLEGKTRKEAARHLGCPEGTVAGHLARGRAMLAKRLRRHGLGVSSGSLAAVFSQQASAAPPSIVASTVITVVSHTTPAKVVILAEGVLKAMLVSKLTKTLGVVLALGLIAAGATLAGTAGQDGNRPAALERRVEQAAKHQQTKQPTTSWGEVVGGLQAGLSVVPDRNVHHHGVSVTLVVRIRNVGRESVKFQYIRQFLDENPPTVRDSNGKTLRQDRTRVLGIHLPVEVTLEPGKEIDLESRFGGGPGASAFRYELRPEHGGGEATTKDQPLVVGIGKVTLQYEQVIGNSLSGRMDLDPKLSKLATGKLEVQVQDEEGLTAWGEPVGGLQAGLTLHPKEPIYHFVEAITLSIRVRNVGKEILRFEYLKQCLDENSPIVAEASGKEIAQHKTRVEGFHVPVKVTLAPGQEVLLQSRLRGSELKYLLTPADVAGKPMPGRFPPLFVATGKVSLLYDPILLLDPVLGKLATGKLELQVQGTGAASRHGSDGFRSRRLLAIICSGVRLVTRADNDSARQLN
jgi:RNA polymerase sigma factor (sigma-70 family)